MNNADGQVLSRDLAILFSLFVIVASSAAPIMNIGAQPEEMSKPAVVAQSSDFRLASGILVILGLAACVVIAVLSVRGGRVRAP